MSDLISRQAAIDALKGMAVPLYKDPACEDIWERDRTLDNAIDAIRGLPSVQPERKKGEWINRGRIIRCNKCKIGYATVKGMKSALTYNFCPNCGADMRGDKHETD